MLMFDLRIRRDSLDATALWETELIRLHREVRTHARASSRFWNILYFSIALSFNYLYLVWRRGKPV